MTKYSAFRDYQIRKNLSNHDENIFLLKSFLLKEHKNEKMAFKFMLKLDRAYRTLNGSKLQNRCMHSNKIRSVYRFTNLTKSTLREDLR